MDIIFLFLSFWGQVIGLIMNRYVESFVFLWTLIDSFQSDILVLVLQQHYTHFPNVFFCYDNLELCISCESLV